MATFRLTVRRSWACIFAACAAATTFTLPAFAMEIGASGGGTSYANSVRGRISEPASFIHGSDARTYWVYATFPNGYFFQAGIADASTQWGSDACTTGFSTFVTAINTNNNQQLTPDLYNLQHCGISGPHSFKLAISSSSESHLVWHWYLDGDPIGPGLSVPVTQYHFVRQNAGAITEIVHVGSIGNSAAFPNVRYNPAIQFLTSVDDGWVTASKGLFVTTGDRTCRYALRVNDTDDFQTGLDSVLDPAHCHSYGDVLWDD